MSSCNYYAVAKGHTIGIYNNWDECKKNIDNIENPIYKKFATEEEAKDFIDENINTIHIYTDGACHNNGSKNALAGIGVYFAKDSEFNISRKLEGGSLTNNIAELTAAIEGINIIKKMEYKNKIVVTDSEYVIKCATTYGDKLAVQEWLCKKTKLPPPNVELVKKIYQLTKKYDIKFKHIPAHTNNKDKHSICNYYADKLANECIEGPKETKMKKEKETENKIYLNVSYAQKDDAKSKGARWDPSKKKWYIFETNPNKKELLEIYS
jgi:ribonuclease HI